MFRFEEIGLLNLAIAIPVLVLLFYISYIWNRNKINRLIQFRLQEKILSHISTSKRRWKQLLLLLTILFLSIAWANPQWGSKKETIKSKSADIFIALDISQSMMAEQPNRLERAKRFIERMITDLRGNRIGLILFAGEAYLQMPLTSDYAAASIFVKTANTQQATTQGTAISEAISLASRAFDKEKQSHRAIILFSDGEDHEAQSERQAKEAYDQGIVIYTVSVGSTEGEFIPFRRPDGVQDFKRDENGKLVKSAVNPDLLKSVANNGGGKYYDISSGNSIIEDFKLELEKLDKREIEQESFSDYASYFQYFLFVAIVLLILEFVITEKKKKKLL